MVFDPNVFDADVFDAETNAPAGLASGTGTAANASVLVAPNAEAGTGTGDASDATVSTVLDVYVDAELASGTGAAQGVTPAVAPNAGAGSGTGAALIASGVASNSVAAQAATGTGAASGPSASIAPRAAAASGTGVGRNASASDGSETAPAFQPSAFQTDAFQTTQPIGPSPSPTAGVAAGTGAVPTAHAAIKASAGSGAGTGAAQDATVSFVITIYASAGAATGTGTAFGTKPSVAVSPVVTPGTGAAYDAEPNAYAVDDTVEGDIPTGYMPPLAAPIDDNDTTIIVTTTSGTTPDVPFVVLIDGEQVLVTNVSGTTWTVERGYNGTTASSHGAGTVARPALVRIRVDGVDIAHDVDYRRSRFTTGANGQAGTAEIWVRDLERAHEFVSGVEVIVSFRGVRQWGGYLASIRRQYVFSSGTGQIGDEPRWLLLDCVDYNVLLNKRIYFKPSHPEYGKVKHWPNGTWDAVVINDVVANYLELDDDGLSFNITHVGTPALPQISCAPDASDNFGVGSAGWTWGQVMAAIVSQTGAVYYIDPDKVFRYVDDSDKQSRFGWDGLSDDPDNVNTIGYRDVEFTLDASKMTNDHLQWGAGQGRDEMVFARTEDAASIAEHGLWQTAEVRFDLYCQDSVELRGETWVYGSPQNRRGGKDDRFYSRVTVREPYFRVADVVELESTEFDFTEIAPVRSAEITFPTPWDIRSILTIAHEIDAPWSTLEFWMPQFNFDFNVPGFVLPELPVIDWPPPWQPLDPCEEIDGSCSETFTRTEASSWGTSELSGTWTHDGDVLPSVDGDSGLLYMAGGSDPTTPRGSLAGFIGRATAPLEVLWHQEWDALMDFSAISMFADDGYWAVYVDDRAGINEFNIEVYSATGFADNYGTSLPFNPAGKDFWVRVLIEDTAISARMWEDGDTEPGAWQVTASNVVDLNFEVTAPFLDELLVEATGDDGGTFKTSEITFVQGLDCGTTTVGAALGLPGFESGDPALAVGWSNTEGGSLQISASGATFRNIEDAVYYPVLHRWIVIDPTIIRYSGSWERPAPFETVTFRVTVTRTSDPQTGNFRMVLAPPEVSFPGFGSEANYLTLDYDQNGFSGDVNKVILRSNLYAVTTTMVPDVPYYWEAEASGSGLLGARLWQVGSERPEIAPASSVLKGTLDLGLSFYLQERSVVNSGPLREEDFTKDITIGPAAFVNDAEVGIVDPGDPCADAEPGEFTDPLHDGPEVGEGADTDFEVGDNGGIIFHTDQQFQLGSTEVWVDGLRIRLGADYVEYPRQAMIEILDHIDVGTAEDPATITVNYVIWTIDDPMLE